MALLKQKAMSQPALCPARRRQCWPGRPRCQRAQPCQRRHTQRHQPRYERSALLAVLGVQGGVGEGSGVQLEECGGWHQEGQQLLEQRVDQQLQGGGGTRMRGCGL